MKRPILGTWVLVGVDLAGSDSARDSFSFQKRAVGVTDDFGSGLLDFKEVGVLDEDAVGLGGLLEAGGDVDGFADGGEDHSVVVLEGAREHVAGGNTDAEVDLFDFGFAAVEVSKCSEHLAGREDGVGFVVVRGEAGGYLVSPGNHGAVAHKLVEVTVVFLDGGGDDSGDVLDVLAGFVHFHCKDAAGGVNGVYEEDRDAADPGLFFAGSDAFAEVLGAVSEFSEPVELVLELFGFFDVNELPLEELQVFGKRADPEVASAIALDVDGDFGVDGVGSAAKEVFDNVVDGGPVNA